MLPNQPRGPPRALPPGFASSCAYLRSSYAAGHAYAWAWARAGGPWPCWERPVSSRPYAWQHRLIGTGHNGLWNGGVACLPYTPPVVSLLHFMSKPFRLFYAYESATPIVSLFSSSRSRILLSPSPSPLLCFARNLLPSFSLLLF